VIFDILQQPILALATLIEPVFLDKVKRNWTYYVLGDRNAFRSDSTASHSTVNMIDDYQNEFVFSEPSLR